MRKDGRTEVINDELNCRLFANALLKLLKNKPLMKLGVRTWIGFIWLIVGSSAGNQGNIKIPTRQRFTLILRCIQQPSRDSFTLNLHMMNWREVLYRHPERTCDAVRLR